ncbi:DUF4407 domain-containing protein [Algoriphagus taiwanensis]|uniref:DUF4407 domain-containing protein n=1 Tax=Algoriphagus taiwanensis TaxID=1445656 RepID=A0ABQ6PVF1_9BACT|nr:hypothetical protein Ataiwa_02130 [Algoriphagus taiwanensis]
MLLRLFSALFGYNYEVVKAQTTVSKQKIITMGTLVLIPVSLWFFSGYYLSTNLYGASLPKALLIGAGLATLILIIDRAFIVQSKEPGASGLAKFRVLIAILSTALGSLAMDLMIFSGDLKEYQALKSQDMKEDKISEYKIKFGGKLERLKVERQVANDNFGQVSKEYISEVDGTNGTGKYGLGPAAIAKEKRMQEAKMALNKIDALFASEQTRLDSEADSVANKAVINEGSSLISKVRDLHEFAFSGLTNFFYYAAVTLFFFCLEFFPFKYKSKTAESLFEKMLHAEEKVGERRLHNLMARREEILRQNGLLGHRAEKIRQLASGYENIRKIG